METAYLEQDMLSVNCDLLAMLGSRRKRLGLLGGTFDPIHYGHLDIAAKARDGFALHRMVLLPAKTPPHKPSTEHEEPEHRLEMARLAVKDKATMEVWDIELRRSGTSYTVDTLMEISLATSDEYDLFYVCGSDTFLDLLSWQDIGRVLQLCTMLVVYRPGSGSEPVQRMKAHLEEVYSAQIFLTQSSGPDISSTEIRERLALGLSVSHLIPRSVEDYIRINGLYERVCS